MQLVLPSLRRRAIGPALSTLQLVVLLTGCQSYERAPLDLPAHQVAMMNRVLDTEPVAAFAARLRGGTAETPGHFDIADGISSAEAEVMALFYNTDLRLARLEEGVALANAENAGLWEDPEFGFDGTELLSPSGPFEFGLTLNVTIPVSGRLQVEKDRARAAHDTALRRVQDAEWSVRADIRRAWALWTAAMEREQLLIGIIEQVDRLRLITSRLEAAGELSRVEGRLFRIELTDRNAALAQVEFEAAHARMALLKLMGLLPDAAVVMIPGFPSMDPSTDGVEQMIEANTELAIDRAAYQVAEETLRLEIQKQYPDITIGGGYGSEDNDDRLLLGFSIPIPLLNANRAGIAEAKASRDVARAVVERTFEHLLFELATAHAAQDAARRQRDRYESEIVPMLEEQTTEIETIAGLGEVNTLLLLETVTRQFDAKSRLLDLRLAEQDASITVVQLLGPAPMDASVEHIDHNPTPEADNVSPEEDTP